MKHEINIGEPEITLVTQTKLSASGCPPTDCPPNAACGPNTNCNPFGCLPALRPCGPDSLGCYPTGKGPQPPRPGPRPPCYPG